MALFHKARYVRLAEGQRQLHAPACRHWSTQVQRGINADAPAVVNEPDRSSSSDFGGVSADVNATVEATVLIFERCIKPAEELKETPRSRKEERGVSWMRERAASPRPEHPPCGKFLNFCYRNMK